MMKSVCTCDGCKAWEATPKALGATKMRPPLEKPKVPGYFKWKAMPAANQYWTYLVTCKMCKWEKFSDYHNALEWLWWHDADDCRNPNKRWSTK